MVSFAEIVHPDHFESFCGTVCSQLELGAPVHLAPGPDRGKDLCTRTPLQTGGERIFSIHIECKFSARERSLGVRDLITHCGWAEARGVDVLLLMTNSRLSASAVDWLEETSTKRSFPVVVWDGEFLRDLVGRLRDSEGLTGSPVRSIHRLLVGRWRDHRRADAGAGFEPRLEERFEAPTITVRPDFVNREEELALLCDFSTYGVAAVTGPAGIGKTVLAQRVSKEAERAGYRVVPVRLDGRGRDLEHIAVPLARTLEALFEDGSLASRLRVHLWEDISELLAAIVERLSRYELFVVIEDAHVLAPDSRTAQLLELCQTSSGSSRLLLTSRVDGLWRGCLVAPELTVSLTGFGEADIRTLFSRRRVNCTREIATALATRYGGWPILVSLSCAELGIPGDKSDVAVRFEGGDLQAARTLAERLLASLSESARRLFTIVLCLREKLVAEEVRLLCALSETDYGEAWIELTEKGLVAPTAAPENCVHDLLKEALRPSLPSAALTDSALADYLLLFDLDADRALSAAEHCLLAGDAARAARTLISRQDVILRSGRVAPLLRLLASLAPDCLGEIAYVELVIVRARCYELQSRFAESLDTLATFIHEGVRTQLPPELLAQSEYWKSRAFYFLGRYKEAERHLIEASRAIGDKSYKGEEGALEGYILLQRGRIKYITRDLETSRDLYQSALSIFEREADTIGANTANHRLAMIDVAEGHFEQALQAFERVRIEARRHRDAKREAYALHRMGHVKRRQGEWEKADQLLNKSLRIKKDIGHRRGFVFSYLELADLALDLKDLEKAEEQIKAAQIHTDELEMPKEQAGVLAAWARLSAAEGDRSRALVFGQEAAAQFEALGLKARADAVRRQLKATGENPD